MAINRKSTPRQVADRVKRTLSALNLPKWMNPALSPAWSAPTPKIESTPLKRPEFDQTPIMVGLNLPTPEEQKFNFAKPPKLADLEADALSRAAPVPKISTPASDVSRKLAAAEPKAKKQSAPKRKPATSKPLISKRNKAPRPRMSPLQMLHNPQVPTNEHMEVDFESIGIGELAAIDAEEAANTQASFAEMQTDIQERHTNAINMLIQRLRAVEAHLDRMEVYRVF